MRIIECEQGSDEWFAARRGVPTASRYAEFVKPASGEYSKGTKGTQGYIHELVAEIADPMYVKSTYTSDAMENGNVMEPQARGMYEFENSVTAQQVGFILDDDERFGCSPDSLIRDDGGLELKCPQAKAHVEYLMGGVIPIKYRPQVYGSMIVTGRDWWDFMSYHPAMESLVVRATIDDPYAKSMRESMKKFWMDFQAIKAKVIKDV